MGFLNKRWINLVMLGDGTMDAEEDGLRFAGKGGDPQRTSSPLDMHFRNIRDFRHTILLACSRVSLHAERFGTGRIGVSLPIFLGWRYFASPSTARRLALHSGGNSLPIEFIIMQDPLQRHGLHEVANAIVTGLISQCTLDNKTAALA